MINQELDDLVLRAVQDGRTHTDEIADATGVHRNSVHHILTRLKTKGYISVGYSTTRKGCKLYTPTDKTIPLLDKLWPAPIGKKNPLASEGERPSLGELRMAEGGREMIPL